MELVQLQEQIESFRNQGVRLVAASVDPPDKLRLMREMSGATFEFLSDPDGRLLDVLGMRHAEGRADGVDIAQSSSFLIAADGEIVWLHVAENYRLRPRPKEILAIAEARFGD